MNDENKKFGLSSIFQKILSLKTIFPSSLEHRLNPRSGSGCPSLSTVLIFMIILIISFAFSPALETVYGDVGVEDVDPMVSEVDVEIKDGYYHLTIGLYDRNTWRAIDGATIELYRDEEVSRRYVFDLDNNTNSLFAVDTDRAIDIGLLYHGKTELDGLREAFKEEGYHITDSDDAFLSSIGGDSMWSLSDRDGERIFILEENEDNLEVHELTYSLKVEKGSDLTDHWLDVNTAYRDEPRDRSEMELTLKFPAGNHDSMMIEVKDQADNTGHSVVYFRTLISGKDRPFLIGLIAAVLTALVVYRIRSKREIDLYKYNINNKRIIKKRKIESKSKKVKEW